MSAVLAAKEPGPLNFVWSEFVLVLIIFAILFYLVRKYVVPAFEKNFAARRDAIEGGLERAEKAQAEAKATLEKYQQQLAEARSEAAQIRENARAEAQRTIEELRAQAQEESARIVARGEEQLANQRQAVVRELRGEIGTLAVELSERIVQQRLADDAQVSATVDSFLAGLEAQDDATSASTGSAGEPRA
ncbi:F0F1 ATP synthase subunit B [uncultured Jatrophihabitans sp.]|uniref:F0F1 ATP synthase subunit B n=1 Tax=uncultured Jatrophihabitans sp. TaxID=1610747 RepID=UPI0035CB8982